MYVQEVIVRKGEHGTRWLYSDIPPPASDRPPPKVVIKNPGKNLSMDPGQKGNKSQENCKSSQVTNLTTGQETNKAEHTNRNIPDGVKPDSIPQQEEVYLKTNLDSNKKSLTKGGRGKGGGEVEAELYIEKEVCQTKLQKEKAHIILQKKETPGLNNEKEPVPRSTKREPECTNWSSSPRENRQFYTRLLSLNVNRLVSKKQKLKQIAATAHMEHTGVLCISGDLASRRNKECGDTYSWIC